MGRAQLSECLLTYLCFHADTALSDHVFEYIAPSSLPHSVEVTQLLHLTVYLSSRLARLATPG
jgi:hypothetical protein